MEKVGYVSSKKNRKKAVYLFVGGKDGFISLPVEWFRSVTAGFRPYARRCWGDCSPLTALMMEQRTKFSVRGTLHVYASTE